MQIERFVFNMVGENCYLIWDDNKNAALIDCGAFYEEEKSAVTSFIDKHQLNLVRLLNTHGHFDHVFGAAYISEKYNVLIELCEDERETFENAVNQMQQFLHLNVDFKLPSARKYFKDGDCLHVGNITLKVIETPGHTPGGVNFYSKADGVLFSGDNLFRREIGRCDLPGGNERSLISTLRSKVLTLPGEVVVYPGHGPATTITEEQTSNIYLR